MAAIPQAKPGFIGKIPISNLWLLMLYASNLFRQLDKSQAAVEDNPDEIADLVAELLCHQVNRRLQRNLSFGYRSEKEELSRVRGRIDLLTTERRQLLSKGKIACRFEELTVDTPRNRYVRSALDVAAGLVSRAGLAQRCRNFSLHLQRLGVSKAPPHAYSSSQDRFSRHDSDDQFMIALAELVFNLALPTELSGRYHLPEPDREEVWVRKLFEKAVAGFYAFHLRDLGWVASAGKRIDWQTSDCTKGMKDILPSMEIDIFLEHEEQKRRWIIDTKFTSIVKPNRYGQDKLNSGYLYQLYSYLRTQEHAEQPLSMSASGMLLHPSVGVTVKESVKIQGHEMWFCTVDLAGDAKAIRSELLGLI
ncbi:restriction endonuclease [Endozoicomonas montiporae]|uniref:Restriction endonuclease n=2 Tax=Endozoicomonas montiporae TaxID=1027273 RepID=A0A081NBR0_9GAMM|nr:5-methylcytosine-specific restriction endonuclease system specificity protein McrC [Endozoicomonas montiporae]AMO56182.1 McrBC 5-methylcytosine restriction system component [Endozoicomonas montiporae CL-33]KEQ15883.1 restriction endonuclease [Endozoicomonas montiporae]